MPGFAEEMAEHDDSFKEVVPATGPPVFSDGSHQVIVNMARVEEGTYGWQLVLGFRGLDASTGKPASVRKWHNLPPEAEREPFLAGDLLLLGYDYKERGLSQLEKACVDEEFIGLLCDIGVKTKSGAERDYTNVYINRVHEKVDVATWLAERSDSQESGDVGDAGDADFQGSDDDIPFMPTVMSSGRWGI